MTQIGSTVNRIRKKPDSPTLLTKNATAETSEKAMVLTRSQPIYKIAIFFHLLVAFIIDPFVFTVRIGCGFIEHIKKKEQGRVFCVGFYL